MSKKVNKFLWLGRVVRKKLTRAKQEMLEAVKESRQRRNFTAGAISALFLCLVFGPDFLASLSNAKCDHPRN